MRPIGTIQNEMQATLFGGFLRSQGIDNQVDRDSRGFWEVWVLDDDRIERSKSLLDQFRRNPEDPAYTEASRAAARHRQQEETAQAPKRARLIDARTMFYVPPVALGPVTLGLIAVSIAITLLMTFSENDRLVQLLSITELRTAVNGSPQWEKGLPEIRHGQLWRLFTPMFLHFSILHILFNMLWLRDLGSMIEARKSSWLLPVLVLVLAGTSNLAQYTHSGPAFGGMSGVVYGLLGYIWMQGKFNPASQLSLHPQTVTFMIVWFFICLSGMVGPIANMAHAAGLAVGILWGFLDAHLRVVLRHR